MRGEKLVLFSGLALAAAACAPEKSTPSAPAEPYSRAWYQQTYGPRPGHQYAAACADFAVAATQYGNCLEDPNNTESWCEPFLDAAGKAGTVRDQLESENPNINNQSQCAENASRALKLTGLE